MSDLYTEILNYKQMTFDRDDLIDKYAQSIIDGMDLDSLIEFAYDTIVSSLNDYTDQELVEEVNDYDPELLESVDTV